MLSKTDGKFEAAGSGCGGASTALVPYFSTLHPPTDEHVDLVRRLPPRCYVMWVVGAIVKSRPCAQDIDPNNIVPRAAYYLFRGR